jgi:molecular chaperone GrpE
MSGGETPGEPGAATVDPGRQLSSLLDGFEAWLRTQPPLGPPSPSDGPDLSTLLREFLALRQEINLLTRATRTQQEQNAATLQALATALEQLRKEPPAPAAEDDETHRAQLKGLLEVRDALGRAEREIQKARTSLDQVLAEVEGSASTDDPPLPPLPSVPTVPGWLRWFGVRGPDLAAWQAYVKAIEVSQGERRSRHEAATRKRQEALGRTRQIVASLIEGYGMSVQRLDRLLTALGLEPIPAEGQRFDPELMEALEAVAGTNLPAGEVVEEVRRGYKYKDRVLRYALVRVARD